MSPVEVGGVSRRLPDFPWDALVAYGDRARAHPDGIVDLDGSLIRWLNKKGATAVAVRPDGFVYAGTRGKAQGGQPLPPPPAGFTMQRTTR